jgi:hyperosmotically inducible periplasmic protein
MTMKRNWCGLLLSLGLLITPGLAVSGQTGSKTIDPAKNGNSENDVTRKIRRDLQRNKSLSAYARRLQVMAVGDLITLRGPVRSESERNAVLALAKKHAGNDNVVDQTVIAK